MTAYVGAFLPYKPVKTAEKCHFALFDVNVVLCVGFDTPKEPKKTHSERVLRYLMWNLPPNILKIAVRRNFGLYRLLMYWQFSLIFL